MPTSPDIENHLVRAIANVYRGPLEEFVQRRETVAKELRASGERESASAVKALRKPSRTAWALNHAVLDQRDTIDPLAAAVARTIDAQAAGGDVRAAILELRATVRDFANTAARAADAAGHSIEAGVLASALLALVARPESMAVLHAGCLVEIPDAGGLDFLASLPAPPAAAQSVKPASTAAERAEGEASAREASQKSIRTLEEARARARQAQDALDDAASKLAGADEQLRLAEANALAARDQFDRARHDADAAASALMEAEKATR